MGKVSVNFGKPSEELSRLDLQVNGEALHVIIYASRVDVLSSDELVGSATTLCEAVERAVGVTIPPESKSRRNLQDLHDAIVALKSGKLQEA